MKRDAVMRACPKFDKCSANVCPLDPDWQLRTHGSGDTMCFYLLEAVKPGSDKRFELCSTRELRQQVLAPLPDICSRWSAFQRAVERAKITGSRLDRVAPGRA